MYKAVLKLYMKTKKVVFNKNGSTLAMLLIVLTILMMLGTVIMSLAISNYKMKTIQSNSKRNFYFAESGIEEAYGIIGNVVDQGIVVGESTVEDYIIYEFNPKIEEAREALERGEYHDFIIYLNGDGSLNMQMVFQKLNDVFKLGFEDYMTNGDRLKDEVELESNYKISYKGTKPIITVRPDSLSFQGGILELTVNSQFIYDNITKKVEARYQIKTPDYNAPYYSVTNVETINRNVGWSKAVAAEGNIHFIGGNTEIFGSVYANGQDTDYGGISTMLDGTNVTINGIVSTPKNLQVASSNSNIIIHGSVYAGNALIKAKDVRGDDIENASLNIRKNSQIQGETGSLYTYDDLSLNGEKSSIYIENDFAGVTDGGYSSEHDHSSGIVINTEDIGTNSSLTIENEVFIPGTSYINTFDGMYQTGESISIKGNYRAYTVGLTGIVRSTGEEILGFDDRLNEDNIEFKYFDPLFLVNKLKDTDEELSAIDKSKYFKFYHEELGESSELNLGGATGINISKPDLAKHLGTLVFSNEVRSSNYTVDFEGILSQNQNMYIKMVNFMGADDEKVVDTTGDSQVTFEDRKSVSHWVQFDNLPIGYESPTIDEDRELVLLDSSSKTYALVGIDGDRDSLPLGAIEVPLGIDSSVSGIIILTGDLYLCGEIDFKGTIITKGNVYFLDSNTKKITYDENYVARTIITNGIQSDYNIFNDSYSSYVEITTDAEIGKSTVGSDVVRDEHIKLINWNIK